MPATFSGPSDWATHRRLPPMLQPTSNAVVTPRLSSRLAQKSPRPDSASLLRSM